MASRLTKDLHPYLADAYNTACETYQNLFPNDPKPFLTCTYRSNEEQTKTYAQGRTTPGAKVTNAKAGQSLHNYYPSRAFDIAFVDSDGTCFYELCYFVKFAKIIKSVPSIEWGGDWKSIKDNPHFQFKGDTWELAANGIEPSGGVPLKIQKA